MSEPTREPFRAGGGRRDAPRRGRPDRLDRPGRPERRSDAGTRAGSRGSGRSPGEQGPAAQGRAAQGRAAQGPAAQGPAAQRPAAQGPAAPVVAADVSLRELDRDVQAELGSLRADLADTVGGHVVMAGRLLDSDPEAAYEHAVAARRLASRLGAVREAAGLAAYLSGHYAEALADLRAARRISGSNRHWAVMADCERGLGRPERALRMAAAPEVSSLDAASRGEMTLIAAGARRDLGQLDAALLALRPELTATTVRPWTARLRYAYADTLLAADRTSEAMEWFARAAAIDPEDKTGAQVRLEELQGVSFLDTEDSEDSADAGTTEDAPGA